MKSNNEAMFKKAVDMLEKCKSSPSEEDAEDVFENTYSIPVKIFFTEAVIFPSF